MKIIFLSLFISATLFSFVTYSQSAPCVAWQKCIGGTEGDDGVSIAATPDGGFIVIGDAQQIPGCSGSNANSYSDLLVTKWGADFNLQWQQCFSGNEHDIALKVISVSTGGYLVMGVTSSRPFEGQTTRDMDIFISKLDNNGNKLWTKVYGGSFTEARGILGMGGTSSYGDIIENSDGTFTFITETNSNDGDIVGKIGPPATFDVWVVKINSTGNIIWSKCYGGTNNDGGYGITHTSDGGYIFAAETSSNDVQVTGNHGLADIWLVKITATGILQWQKCMGGSGSDLTSGSGSASGNRGNIITAADGYIYVYANTASTDGDVTGNHGALDNWVIKMDQFGNIVWKKCYGGTGFESLGKLLEDADGNIILSGSSTSANGDIPANYGSHDVFVCKIEATTGNVIWCKNYAGTQKDAGCDIVRLPQNGYVLTGITRSNDTDVSGNLGSADIWIAHLSNTNTPPPVPITSPLLPVYCSNQPPLIVRLLNPPPPVTIFCNQTVTNTVAVMLDNTIALPVGSDSTFVVNIPALAQGSHQIKVTYDNGTVQQSQNFNFSVTSPITPQTDISATPANASGIITFSAANVSGGGTSPLYTFAHDRGFTSLIQAESSSSIATKLNTTFPIGINWVYVRLRTSETCNNATINVDSVLVPIPAIPQTSTVQNEYCGNLGFQTITLNNIPAAIYQASVSVKLNNIPLTLTGNQFSFNPSALPAGVQQLQIQYTNSFITQTQNISFSVTSPITPQTDITATPANASGIITFSAANVSGGGTSPLYTFANDRGFTSLIQAESSSSITTKLNTTFPIGINWVYVRLKTNENCFTRLTDIDSVIIPIPGIPQTSVVSNQYCSNEGVQTISILNIPSAIYQSAVTARLDNIPVTIAGNQFTINPSVISPGVHQIQIQYSNNYIVQTKTIVFNIIQTVTPSVRLTTSASVVTGSSAAITLTAQPINAGGNPQYTFANDRTFAPILAPESPANSISIPPAALFPGNNYLYVRIRTTELCRTREMAMDSVQIWKNGSIFLMEPGNQNSISIFPNPFGANIYLSGLLPGIKYTIRMVDVKGKLVKKIIIQNQSSVTLNTANLASGVYVLTLINMSNNTKTGSIKLIKE
jgi:hypothetical protein